MNEAELHADVFETSMGVLGRYQLWITFLILLVKFPVGWQLLNIIVIGPKVSVTCASPNNTDPCDASCESRIIDPSPFTQTIQSQWHLVCDDKYLADFTQMFMMIGVMVGSFLFGVWADNKGRKLPLICACALQAVCGTAIAFVPWLWLFLVLRFVIGFATGGAMTTSFVLLMELISKRWRVTIGTLYQVPTWFAHLSFAFIGYYFRDWRQTQVLISVPAFLFLSFHWLLPESPRYLLASGRVDEAIAVMERVARANRLPTDAIATNVKAHAIQQQEKSGQTGRLLDLFRPTTICIRTLILAYSWIAVGVCFYGVAQFSGKSAGNIFVNIAISASMEIPGTFIAVGLVSFLGRKWTTMLCCVTAGIPMFVIPFLTEGSIAVPVMGLIAMFGLAALFATVYVYSGELYPTFIRSIGVGFASMTCRIGTVSAPFIASLSNYGVPTWVPPTIFGIFPIVAAGMSFFLPETKNDKLPDTLEDAINLGKKKPH